MGLLIKLKNGDTAFKNIPFGKDRPGGGSSNQPYIKGVGLTGTGIQPIGNAWNNTLNAWSQPGLLPINAAFFKPTNGVGWAGLAQNTLNQFTSLGPLASSLVYAVDNLPNIPDSIIRGGTKALPRSVIDATRLTKYFLDYKSVNGILFLAKQNLLSRVSVKTEPARTSAAYLYGVLNGGVYTPLSTIGQAATGFAGIHLNDKGIDPTGIIPQLSIRNYQDIAFNRNKNDISNENSKGYQRRVDKKIKKLNKLKEQLQTSKEQLQISQNYDPSTDPQYSTETVGWDWKMYPTFEAAMRSILNASRRGTGQAEFLYNLNTGEELTDLNNLTEQESRLLKFAKEEDQKRIKAREKAIKEDKDKEALYSKQVKKLPEQIQDVEEELEELTLGGKYKNRLLRLWDKFGLDINNPVDSTKTTLLSYGGGPGSILGIGKTKIKFATLNDGITPARTGFNMEDPYSDSGYLNYGPGRPNIFSDDRMYNIGPNKNGNSIFFRAGYTAEDYFGDPDYISKLSISSKLLEDNSLILQPWATKKLYATDSFTKVSFVNGEPLSSRKYSTWDPILFKGQLKNDTLHETLEDFRKNLNSQENSTFLSVSPSYTKFNIEKRLGLGGKYGGGPGQPGDLTSPLRGKKFLGGSNMGPLDRVTALPIYESDIAIQDKNVIDDLIKFNISIYNPVTKKNFYMHFRAFIDSFGDSYSADWNKIEYMGRGEKFYKYGGFSRDINLNFTVAAQSREELSTMYRKLNFLASSLAPYYSEKGYMGGNIANLTVGDYLDNQPGIINSLGFEIPEDSPWNIILSDPENPVVDNALLELPLIIKVQMKFTPIQNFRPGIQKLEVLPKVENIKNVLDNGYDGASKFGNQRFISNDLTSNLYQPQNPTINDTSINNQSLEGQNQILQRDDSMLTEGGDVIQLNPFEDNFSNVQIGPNGQFQ